MGRRFSVWWALMPLVAALAYETFQIMQLAELPDRYGYFGLLGAMVSAVLVFGGWPRKSAVMAGVVAAVAVFAVGVANARYVAWLYEVGGVPSHWLLELSAVFVALAVPAGLIVGLVSAVICVTGWFRQGTDTHQIKPSDQPLP